MPANATPPDENWQGDLLSNKSKTPRRLISLVIILVICFAGIAFWTQPTDTSPPPPLPEQISTITDIESEARELIADYLAAQSRGDHEQCLRLVTPSRETQTLLPQFSARKNPEDVVKASAFLLQPLPPSFQNQGIYLMVYQRPNTLTHDAMFRPIVPLRVRLTVDSPSPLELSARRNSAHTENRQVVCAFIKEGGKGGITLDWPLLIQTRHRMLAEFIKQQRNTPSARWVSRLMITALNPILVDHTYGKQLPEHDWYRIHCPGYPQETYIIAVPAQSSTADKLRLRFSAPPDSGPQIHALTAELAWLTPAGNQSPQLTLTRIICWEFYGLNHE